MKRVFIILIVTVLLIGCMSTNAFAADAKTTITIYGTEVTIPDNDKILPVLEEKFNVDLVVEAGDDAGLTARITGGTIPDIMLVQDPATFTTLMKNGVALDVTDYVAGMDEFRAAFTDYDWAKLSSDGRYYGIPRRAENNYYGWYIRRDYLKALGFDQPTTFDELYAYCEALKDADLDGNGQNDTYPISGELITSHNAFDGFFTAYGTGNWTSLLLDGNGGVEYAVTTENFRKAIEEIRRFTSAGFVDPEVIANTWDTVREKMGSGKTGVVYAGWNWVGRNTHKAVINAIDEDADWFYFDPMITTEYGKAGALKNGGGSASKFTVLSVDLEEDPEKLALILELHDYITTGEGDLLMSYGIEGTHYDIIDGVITKLPAMDELGYGYVLQFTGRQDETYCNTKFIECIDAVAYAANKDNVPLIYYWQNVIQTPVGYNIADMKAYVEEMVYKFIFGELDMEKWDDFINDLYTTYDLQTYLDSAVEQLTAMGVLG